MAAGIDTRHSKACASRQGGARCSCRPSYQAHVFDSRTNRRVRKSFKSYAEARTWRQDALIALRAGPIAPVRSITVQEAGNTLVDGMRDGSILDRTGKPYKPSTVRAYEQALSAYVVPALGLSRLAQVRRRDVQDAVEKWRAQGLAAGTIHNKLDPLRVIYRRAIHRDEVTIDPTKGLELPANRGRRDRIETPERAAALIVALPEAERALWATAFYAGLRRGELRALRWEDVDFDQGVIRVVRGWDDVEGPIEAKSDAGRRSIPVASVLRRELAAHKLRTGRSGGELVFGRDRHLPFTASTVNNRATAAWKAAGLERLTAHEARHCAASYLIAAGVNAKELSVYIGHSDIRTTFNRYGHLLPGGEAEAAAKLDALFSRDTRATVAPAIGG